MRVVKSVNVEEILARGSIKDADVIRLTERFIESPGVTEQDAEALFYLNRACPIQAPGWNGLFVDTLADFHIQQMVPGGYITAEKSEWLISLIATEGRVVNRNEFDLMAAVMRRSRWFPLSLLRFAMGQVRDAIVHGAGPLRAGLAGVGPGQIISSDVSLLRDMMCAFAGGSSLPVLRCEVELMLDIEAQAGHNAAPAAWTDLLAKVLADAVLSNQGYVGPSREQALRPAEGMSEQLPICDRVTVGLAPLMSEYIIPTAEEIALARLERQRIEIVTNEDILSGQDSSWLERRLQGAVPCFLTEREVVRFLTEEGRLGYRPAMRA